MARLAAWFIAPWQEFGLSGDEVSYYRCGMRLILLGGQDLFWAPMAGWVIAIVSSLFRTERIHLLRLAWVVLDTLNVVLLFRIALRLWKSGAKGGRPEDEWRPAFAVAFAYALYLPAIGYATHLTGESLSLTFMLAGMWIANWGPPFRLSRTAVAGLLLGAMVLTRPNLAPIAVAFAFGISALNWNGRLAWRETLLPVVILVCMAATPPLAWVARNVAVTGYVFLNLSYPHGFYRATLDAYKDDLRFVESKPSQSEVENRKRNSERAMANNLSLALIQSAPSREGRRALIMERFLEVEAITPQEVFERRTSAILRATKDHRKATITEQVRRAVSRLARTLAPKTGVFDLVPRSLPLTDVRKFGLFAVANLQWAIILTSGLSGLIAGAGLRASTKLLLLALLAGGLLPALLAHGEPRYSFPVEFVLLISSVAFFSTLKESLKLLWGSRWRAAALVFSLGFVGWAWFAAARWGFAGSIRATW